MYYMHHVLEVENISMLYSLNMSIELVKSVI